MTPSRLAPAAQQARSRKTHRVLMNEGFKLLEEQGVDALTIAALSARAGVAVGTVYRRFGDKEGLLLELEEEFTAEVVDEIRQRMRRRAVPAEGTPSEAVSVAVRSIVETFQAQQRLFRVFAVLGLREPTVFEIGSRASREAAKLFRDLLWPFRGSFTRPDAERALDVAHRVVYAACMHRVLNGPNMESATEFTWDDAADELVRVVDLTLLGRL